MWKYVGATFLERKHGAHAVSLGRTSFLVVFGIACWRWGHNQDVPNTLLTFLGMLLAYVISGKITSAVSGIKTAHHRYKEQIAKNLDPFPPD